MLMAWRWQQQATAWSAQRTAHTAPQLDEQALLVLDLLQQTPRRQLVLLLRPLRQ
jgi:hypothetical protein